MRDARTNTGFGGTSGDTVFLVNRHRASVLVVEDDPTVLSAVVRVLELDGHRVTTAKDGRSGLETIMQDTPDVVVMDVMMPHMDGIEATRTLRASPLPRVASTPVIGLTANVNQQDLARFEAAGLNVLMLKPFEPEKLCEQIERLLDLRAPSSTTDSATKA